MKFSKKFVSWSSISWKEGMRVDLPVRKYIALRSSCQQSLWTENKSYKLFDLALNTQLSLQQSDECPIFGKLYSIKSDSIPCVLLSGGPA